MAEPGAPDRPGFELPLLLFSGFRTLIDRLHAELAERGHPDVRPAHGFAMQAIWRGGDTAGELGRRLGVSKQAAGKAVERLERLGYVERVEDPADARRRRVRLTERGADMLAVSAEVLERLRAEWAAELGGDRLRGLEDALAAVTAAETLRLDAQSWFGD